MAAVFFALLSVVFLACACWEWSRGCDAQSLGHGFAFLVCFIIVLRKTHERRCHE